MTAEIPKKLGNVSIVEELRFLLVCAFLGSQIYLVPLMAVGPSWAIWPAASDVVIACMVPLSLLPFSSKSTVSRTLRGMWTVLLIGAIACLFSYAFFTLYALRLDPSVGYSGKSVWFGAAQLYRVAQALVVYRCAAALSINPTRIWIMKRLSLAVFVLICASVQATYSGLVTTTMLSQHLPADQATAGPWADYVVGMREGLGSIGYNHGYTAIEVLVAGALCLYFYRRSPLVQSLVPVLVLASCLVSGSRAGLLAALFFALVVWGIRLQTLLLLACCLFAIAAATSLDIAGSAEYLQDAYARQGTVRSSLDEDGFSGRTQIWTEKIQYLNASPKHWIFGFGFGSAIETGTNAHLEYLHVILETGLIGLCALAYWQWRIISSLWHAGKAARPLFWVCIALLLTCLDQESLYPVAAYPIFLSFYIFAITICLRAEDHPVDRVSFAHKSRRNERGSGQLAYQ